MKKQHVLKYEIKSEINVVPFLDILLVLLIVFIMMPSKLLIQQGFEINLPNSDAKTEIIKNKRFLVTIEILKTGVYNLSTDHKNIKNIYLNQLMSEIKTELVTHANITCLIAASKEEKYNKIIQILNMLNNIGINSIGMLTNPTNKNTQNSLSKK